MRYLQMLACAHSIKFIEFNPSCAGTSKTQYTTKRYSHVAKTVKARTTTDRNGKFAARSKLNNSKEIKIG